MIDMHDANLIPAYRIGAKRRRTRVRAWSALVGTYTAILCLAAASMSNAMGGDDDISADVQGLVRQIEDGNRERRDLLSRLTASRALLHAGRVISERPDWSLLLALISHIRGDDVVLSNLSLESGAESGSGRTEQGTHVVHVSGFGRSQAAVSGFALRLERSGIFGKVRVINSYRKPFVGGTAITFELECYLGVAGGAMP